MKPRIAFVLPNLAGGGAERVAITLAEAFIKKGVAVDFVLFNATGELIQEVPTEARLFDLRVARFRQGFRGLTGHLRNERPDAVLAFMWPLTSLCVVANLLAGRPSRIVVADHNTESVQAQLYGWKVQAALALSMRATYPFAHARVSISEGVRSDSARVSGLAPDKFTLIANPVQVASARGEPVDDPIWSAPRNRRIISVGNLRPQKNQRLLIDAFALLSDRAAELVIVGEGPDRALLEQRIAELGLESRVKLAGFRTDAQCLLRSAAVFALSSDFEGLPLALVEALAAGLSVVSTDCPSGPAEILAGGLGRLVPPRNPRALAEAIELAFADRPNPEAVAARVAAFDPSSIADRYLSVLLPSRS